MKKLQLFLLSLILSVVIVNCTRDQAALTEAEIVSSDKEIQLLNSTYLGSKWTYRVLLPKDWTKDKSNPGIFTVASGWKFQNLNSYDADYFLWSVTVPDTTNYLFTYVGNYSVSLPQSQWSWANIPQSKYYNKTEDKLALNFKQGVIYSESEIPKPGETGDAFVRFTYSVGATADTLKVFFNKTKLNGSLTAPFSEFWNYSVNRYTDPIPMQVVSGFPDWGKQTLVITADYFNNGIFKFKYGAYYSGNSVVSWGNENHTQSAYWNVSLNCFSVTLSSIRKK